MSTEQHIYSYSAVLMGSPILLKLFDNNQTLAAKVFRLIKQQEIAFTVNRPHSEVMSINHAAGLHPVAVSAPVYQLIKRAKEISLLPNSCFSLTIGPLVKLWKIGFGANNLPDNEELQRLLSLTNPHDLQLNDSTREVFLNKIGMEIDLGAIAKGYIADMVRDFLYQQQVKHGLINLGGNVQTLGASTEKGWSIGIKKPFASPDALIAVLKVSNKSVVTSGIYERYFELGGQRYHHILDPQTGYPLDNELLSVTVISDDSIEGDIYTTLLYGLGVTKSLALLAKKTHIEAIFVTKERQIILSSQHQFSFSLLDNDYQLA